jgi:hypothetical protein
MGAALGTRTRAEAARQLLTDLDLDRSACVAQRLRVGVHGDELHAWQVLLDHPVDGIVAAAPDADDAHSRRARAALC